MSNRDTWNIVWNPIRIALRTEDTRRMIMRISIPIAVLAILGVISFSCGRYQGESENITAKAGSMALGAGETPETRASVEELAGVIRAFGEDGAAFDEDFLSQNSDTLDKLIAGSSITLPELGALLMTDQPPSLDLGGVFDPAKHPVATFRWIPENGSLDRQGLVAALGRAYPSVKNESRAALADSLLGFDRTVFGGNQDASIDRQEADIPGIVIAAIEKMDTSQLRLTAGVSEENKATISFLRSKFNKQSALVHAVESIDRLSDDDLRMEWMRLGLELMQIKRALIPYKGQLPLDKLSDLYTAFRMNLEQDTQKLARFYDSRFSGGNADGKLNALEAHNLVSDLRFGARVAGTMAQGMTGLLNDPMLVTQMFSAYPLVGPCLFLQRKECGVTELAGATLRTSYFNGLREYDTAKRGGNGDGKLGRVELTMALNYVSVLDTIYLTYDADHDSRVSKGEARKLMEDMGISDERAIDAFFAGVGLDSGKVNFWEGFTLFLVNTSGVEYLRPHEFHRRMEKILGNYI